MEPSEDDVNDSMPESMSELTDEPMPEPPKLWNPNAAAAWSLLFTPAFGAFLHAINWRALGSPERARTNMVWVWLTVVYLIVNLGTAFLPESKTTTLAMQAGGFGMLLGWYFSLGRSQTRYVTETFGESYAKRGWGPPLLIGVGVVVVYFVAIVVLLMAFDNPDPEELAAEVKPLILKEWHKEPELRGATIQKITLTHKGGDTYEGFVDATLAGQPTRLALEVVYNQGTIRWETKPIPEK